MPIPESVFGHSDASNPNCPLPKENDEPDETRDSHPEHQGKQPDAPETD